MDHPALGPMIYHERVVKVGAIEMVTIWLNAGVNKKPNQSLAGQRRVGLLGHKLIKPWVPRRQVARACPSRALARVPSAQVAACHIRATRRELQRPLTATHGQPTTRTSDYVWPGQLASVHPNFQAGHEGPIPFARSNRAFAGQDAR